MKEQLYKLLQLGCFSMLLLSSISVHGQVDNIHQQSSTYEYPEDPQVLAKLDKWQDQKFGIIIHWGLYAVPGIIESWALCSEDWIERDSTVSYPEFKEWYWGLQQEFNPINFNPEHWASVAKGAGMRYLVFTTKHHDGFSMFDTQQSNFKITNGPFANNPRADVAKHVFNAFRQEDFMIGAYFSKPDWHSEYYWWPKYATANRNNNYDIRKNSWRWNKFKDFTHGQIRELMHNYGPMDILWLDGGWVRPRETINAEVLSWGAPIPDWSQDIDMPRIAAMAREAQPGLLMVDRTVHGPYENYQTPERNIPDKQLAYPWESCIPLANNWGYVPDDEFKTSAQVIHSLVEVVAKGGSLLLGIGPKPDGTLPQIVENRLQEVGDWLKVNGKAIYETRTAEHYQDGRVFFTRDKNNRFYAIALLDENKPLPKSIEWSGNRPAKGSKITLLENGKALRWVQEGEKIKVFLPKSAVKRGNQPALAFSFDMVKP